MRRFCPGLYLQSYSYPYSLAALTGCGGSSATFQCRFAHAGQTSTLSPPGQQQYRHGHHACILPPRVTPSCGCYRDRCRPLSSSNPSVLSFVPPAGGLACAGRWDSRARFAVRKARGRPSDRHRQRRHQCPRHRLCPSAHRHDHAQPVPVLTADSSGQLRYPGHRHRGSRTISISRHKRFGQWAMDVTNTVGSFTFLSCRIRRRRHSVSTTDPELRQQQRQPDHPGASHGR